MEYDLKQTDHLSLDYISPARKKGLWDRSSAVQM
jgi:hypothetical protein